MLSVEWLVTLAIGLLAIVIYITTYIPSLRTIFLFARLPGPVRLPLIGVSLEAPFIPYSGTMEWLKTTFIDGFDRISSGWLIGLPMVFLNDPRDVEVLLSSVTNIQKGEEYISFKPWLEDGLLISNGTKWHVRRKALTPAFHFKILDQQCSTIFANTKLLLSKLLQEGGKPMSVEEKVSRCTLDVMSEAAMGISLKSQDEQKNEYVACIKRMTMYVVYRVLNLYLHRQWLFALTPVGRASAKDVDFLHSFTSRIVSQRRAAYSEHRSKNINSHDNDNVGERKKLAFLDQLLELDMTNGIPLNDSDIRQEVDTFLFEGHDTTASAITFGLFELGHNQDIQEKAYQEQLDIFQNDTREPTMSDLLNMNYLEKVIKEILRLYPSVPYISRKLREDIQLEGLPLIPRGSNAVVTPFFMHRNPKYYPDPERFDPERFTLDECTKRHPFSYIPFSAGPRNCIGQKFAMMELKITFSTFLRFARVESISKRSDIQLAPLTILRSLNHPLIRTFHRM